MRVVGDDRHEVGEHGSWFPHDVVGLAGDGHHDRCHALGQGPEHLSGEARLAGAAVADERHALGPQGGVEQGSLGAAVADELVERHVVRGEVVPPRRGIERVFLLQLAQEVEAHAGPTSSLGCWFTA